MPVYCYTTKDGETFEEMFAIGQAPERTTCGGKTAWRDRRAEWRRRDCAWRKPADPWAKPLKSEALGVHPEQIQKFKRDAAGAGIDGIDFDRRGTCLIRDRQSRNAYMKFRGQKDLDGGYGDYTGN